VANAAALTSYNRRNRPAVAMPVPAIGLSGAGAEGAVEVLTLTVRPMIRFHIGTGTVPINGRGLAVRHTPSGCGPVNHNPIPSWAGTLNNHLNTGPAT
jgi:hypothetical protein